MLSSLPIAYLLLMAAAATFVFTFVMTKCFSGAGPTWKLALVFSFISIGCGLGIILTGGLQYQPATPREMLVLYSFAWVGLAVGMFLSRKFVRKCIVEYHQGIQREKPKMPLRYYIALIAPVILMCALAFVLS